MTVRAPKGVDPRKSRSGSIPRRICLGIFFSAIPAILLLVALRAAGVPLGERGRMVYGYSGFMVDRLLTRTWPLLPASAGVAAGVWLLGSAGRGRRAAAAGAMALSGAMAILAAWSWWAPIAAVGQHVLNLGSPGQDGAFVIESRTQPTARAYLHTVDRRISMSPDALGSTRVISNPPGMTLLVYGVRAAFPAAGAGPPGALERWLVRDEGIDAAGAAALAPAVRLSIALTAAWAGSALFAFLLGRQFLSRAGAAVFMLVVTFNPCTLNFTPGKDPAQLLTINAMLWAWFAAWRARRAGRSTVWAGASGLALGIGMIFGLIHAWVIAIAVAAVGWEAARVRRLRSLLLRQILPLTLAAAATIFLIGAAFDWNVSRTLVLVWRRFNEVQRMIYPNRTLWLAIGLPIFLLFLSPGTLLPTWLSLRRSPRHRSREPLARPLLVATGAAMAITYVVGVSYELPRLWVAFLPTLTLGAMAAAPLFRDESPRGRPALLALALAQIAFSAVHFCVMDARQSEQRITSGRMFSTAGSHEAVETPMARRDRSASFGYNADR